MSRLEQILAASIDQEGQEKDLTMSFQMEYNTPDRSILRARMVTDQSVIVTIGLRSAILEPCERFHIPSDGEFLA